MQSFSSCEIIKEVYEIIDMIWISEEFQMKFEQKSFNSRFCHNKSDIGVENPILRLFIIMQMSFTSSKH